MKNSLHYILLVLVIILIFSCQSQKKETIPVVDIENNLGKIDQKFSDMAENICAVPLETNDSCLLASYFELWVGKEYIITLDKEAIHLFNSAGRHIRKLAQKGRGPYDYYHVGAWAVDESKKRLYYINEDYGTNINHIRFIDWENGDNTGKLKINIKPDVIIVDDDHSFIFYSERSEWNTEKHLFTEPVKNVHYISETGNLLYTLPIDTLTKNKSERRGFSNYYFGKNDDHITYTMFMSDTIYQIKERQKEPFVFIKLKDALTKNKESGNTFKVMMEERQNLFLSVMETSIKITNTGYSISSKVVASYRINKESKMVHQIDRFYIDILDYYDMPHPMIVGDKMFYRMSVLRIKELATQKMKNGEKLSPRLKELSEQLTDDDNPVIIVGDLK